jgi:drug/metabolite transporter, DME family
MLSTRKAVGSVFLGALLFSTTGTAQQLADAGSTPLGVGASRLFCGGLLLVMLLPSFGQRRVEVVRLWRRPWILMAGMSSGVFQVTFFAAVQEAGVALGTLIVVGTGPVAAGLLGWVLLRERITASWAAATSVCLAGLVLLSSEGVTGGTSIGVLLSVVAGCSIATYTVSAKQILNTGVHPVLLMASTFIFGGFFLVPLYVLEPLGWLLTPRGIALVLYLGVVTMAAANWLHIRGLSVLGPAPVTTLMLAEPLLAAVLGVALLGETISNLAIAGFVLVMLGLLLQGTVLARTRTAMPSAVPPT